MPDQGYVKTLKTERRRRIIKQILQVNGRNARKAGFCTGGICKEGRR